LNTFELNEVFEDLWVSLSPKSHHD
jgi:hypothetical protein